MARGKGKGPMGVRPDPESDSQATSSQSEGYAIRPESEGDSADDSSSPRDALRGRRRIPVTRVRVRASQSVIQPSQGLPTSPGAETGRGQQKRKGDASSSQPQPRKVSIVPAAEPLAPEGHTSADPVGFERGEPTRRRAVVLDHAGVYPSMEFVDKEAEMSWEAVVKRGVVPERRATLREDARLPIRQLFEAVDWGAMLRPKDYYYLRLVRLFYCNMSRKVSRDGDVGVRSWVLGHRVRITPTSLADALHLSCEGTKWEFTNDTKKLEKLVPRSEIMDAICCRAVGTRQPKSRDLTPICRVLLNLVNTNVLPKGGHREAVPPGYAFVLYCVVKGIRLSLPHLMLSFMVYCTMDSKTAHSCPYPAAVTAMFERANMNLAGLDRTDIRAKFDSATLSRMRIRVPVDEREPLQVDASLATGTRTSAATSHQGDDSREPAHAYGTGAADEATSRPPDLGGLKDDVLALKYQQAQIMEQLERIQASQADMVHQLRIISDVLTGRRLGGSSPVCPVQTPTPAPQFSDVQIPFEGNVGVSEVEVVFGTTTAVVVAEDEQWLEVPAEGREHGEAQSVATVVEDEADTLQVHCPAPTHVGPTDEQAVGVGNSGGGQNMVGDGGLAVEASNVPIDVEGLCAQGLLAADERQG